MRQRSKNSALRAKEKRMPEPQNTISEADRDTTPRVAPLPPQRVSLPTSSPVIQIACGLHHTVVLTQSGEVFTFGSNQYGQLGNFFFFSFFISSFLFIQFYSFL